MYTYSDRLADLSGFGVALESKQKDDDTGLDCSMIGDGGGAFQVLLFVQKKKERVGEESKPDTTVRERQVSEK